MAFTEIYVTKGASASDINGGGESLGADDGPKYTSADVTSNAGGDTLTDNSGNNWAGVSQGSDFICFDTAGVQDVARITFIEGATATVSPAVTGALANKAARVGGALATIQRAADVFTTAHMKSATTPIRINIKYDAASYADVDIDINTFTYDSPIYFEGYQTTPGDLGSAPTIDGTGSGDHAFYLSVPYIKLINLIGYTNTAGKAAFYVGSLATYCDLITCSGSAGPAAAAGSAFYSPAAGTNFLDCTATAFNAYGFYTGNYNFLAACVAYGASSATSCFRIVDRCICIACIGDGEGSCGDIFDVTRYAGYLWGCIAIDSDSGSGILLNDDDGGYVPTVMNCIMMGNNQYGLESDFAYYGMHGWNAYYNNSAGAKSANIVSSGTGDVTLTANPFTDSPGHDYSLNSAAGGGALCKATGFPGALYDGTNVGYLDIGTLQHAAAGGGSAILRGTIVQG